MSRDDLAQVWGDKTTGVANDATLEALIERIPAVMAAQHQEPLVVMDCWRFVDRTSPSREFMIQQATLTTLHNCYPLMIEVRGVSDAAHRVSEIISRGDTIGMAFVGDVRAEFHRLEAQYAR